MNLSIKFDSIKRGTITKSLATIAERITNRKWEQIKKEAKEWKLDVKAWLNRSRHSAAGTSEGISRDGPLRKTGQLRNAAGLYSIKRRVNKNTGEASIFITTRFKSVDSYSKNQKQTWNYSDILDNTTVKYYSGYKTRYRAILYKRLEKVIHGTL